MKGIEFSEIQKLKLMAVKIRTHIIEMLTRAKSGHPGGSLSCVEALTALYFAHMKHDPNNPTDPNRDRFILSKGHAAPALYAVLAECGYFDIDELGNLRVVECMLQGHPACNLAPGVEASTGSLGHGIGLAVGMALAFKIQKTTRKVYTIVGDGESNEGTVWEALLVADNLKLDNLTIIYDNNMSHARGLQITNPAEKFEAFGCHTIEVHTKPVGLREDEWDHYRDSHRVSRHMTPCGDDLDRLEVASP